MRRFFIIITLLNAVGVSAPAMSETFLAARTIRSQTVLTRSDIEVVQDGSRASISLQDIIGMETQVVLYVGREIHLTDIGAPTIIERNQIVPLIFKTGPLSISTEARSLGRAGIGDRLRVMNLSSRTTVFGTVTENGEVVVSSNYN